MHIAYYSWYATASTVRHLQCLTSTSNQSLSDLGGSRSRDEFTKPTRRTLSILLSLGVPSQLITSPVAWALASYRYCSWFVCSFYHNNSLTLQWSDSGLATTCVFKESTMQRTMENLLASKALSPKKSPAHFASNCKLTRLHVISVANYLSSL